jgi:hypothetical protein
VEYLEHAARLALQDSARIDAQARRASVHYGSALGPAGARAKSRGNDLEEPLMPPARKREPIVPAKVKAAVDYMFATPGATLQSAAAHVGMVPRMLRFQMTQPHVLRWMLQEKQARLEAASAGNIGALLSVRDYGDNAMAKVHAAKTLETMLDAVSERTGIGRAVQQQRVPGLQIVIVQNDGSKQVVAGPPPMPMLDVTPAPEAEPARLVQDAPEAGME